MAENKIVRRVGRIRAKKGARMPAEREKRKKTWLRAAGAGAAAWIVVCMLAGGIPAEAGDLKVVHGIVGTVTGHMVFLDGKSVDLAGVPIRTPSGEALAVTDIRPGTKVGLYYRRGTLTSVLVYPSMVE